MQKQSIAPRSAKTRVRFRREGEAGLEMRKEDIDRFIEELRRKGRKPDTLDIYRHSLNRLYDSLPADKRIFQGTLATWQRELIAGGYSLNTVNRVFTACNSWLDFMNCRQYQQAGYLETEDKLLPELTRKEYLNLLQAAKVKNKERTYLLVKVFATTGIHVQELEKITVEAVTAGRTVTAASGIKQTIRFPECLQRELLAYAKHKGIASGPIFITKNGMPMVRTNVTTDILRLSEFTQVPREKANPRCLRKLYQTTRESIEANLALLVEQTMDRQLEQEQLSVGWDA